MRQGASRPGGCSKTPRGTAAAGPAWAPAGSGPFGPAAGRRAAEQLFSPARGEAAANHPPGKGVAGVRVRSPRLLSVRGAGARTGRQVEKPDGERRVSPPCASRRHLLSRTPKFPPLPPQPAVTQGGWGISQPPAGFRGLCPGSPHPSPCSAGVGGR